MLLAIAFPSVRLVLPLTLQYVPFAVLQGLPAM